MSTTTWMTPQQGYERPNHSAAKDEARVVAADGSNIRRKRCTDYAPSCGNIWVGGKAAASIATSLIGGNRSTTCESWTIVSSSVIDGTSTAGKLSIASNLLYSGNTPAAGLHGLAAETEEQNASTKAASLFTPLRRYLAEKSNVPSFAEENPDDKLKVMGKFLKDIGESLKLSAVELGGNEGVDELMLELDAIIQAGEGEAGSWQTGN